MLRSGFDTFSNVSYAIVGGGSQGWGGPVGGPMTSPSSRGTTMTTKYEPELKFIDEEQVQALHKNEEVWRISWQNVCPSPCTDYIPLQDDYDEAPRLTEIRGSAGGLCMAPKLSESTSDYQMTERSLNTPSGNGAPVQDLEMDEGPVSKRNFVPAVNLFTAVAMGFSGFTLF